MDRRLLALGLGTFHTLLFFVLLVLALHLNQGLDTLLLLGTGPGALVFLVFWLVTVWSTAMALDGIAEGNHPLKQAALWGAAEGFLLLVLLLVAISILESPLVFTAFPVGSAASVVVGGLVGLLFGGLDRLLLDLPLRDLRRPAPTGDAAVPPESPVSSPPDDSRSPDENEK